jgi:isopentenyl diphosphate isomerase/L-lactate dehydrogenase-like FMN-dependent dehydrogenase
MVGSVRDYSCELFGRKLPAPVVMAPCGRSNFASSRRREGDSEGSRRARFAVHAEHIIEQWLEDCGGDEW